MQVKRELLTSSSSSSSSWVFGVWRPESKRTRYLCKMFPSCSLLFSIWALLFHGVSMLRLADLRIPSHTIRGQPVRLECHYDLEGEALYSVKWYKDNKEFFRFLPGDDPPAQVFNQPGVIVDLPNSSDTAVALKGVDLDGSGVYRCEVSGEAPSFTTVSDSREMLVVDLPKDGPHITGGRPRYLLGDTVRVNCTSDRSRPAATLSWFINGEPAEDLYVLRYSIMRDEDGLETSILGLEFKVRPKHFRKGDLKLKCLATIAQLYWRSNEESVESDRPQKAPVLESRETFNPGKREASSHSSSGGISWTMNHGSSTFISSSSSIVLLISAVILFRNFVLGTQALGDHQLLDHHHHHHHHHQHLFLNILR